MNYQYMQLQTLIGMRHEQLLREAERGRLLTWLAAGKPPKNSRGSRWRW